MVSVHLLGMKHSGKSTLGKLLAQKTGRKFLDLDTLLEQSYGQNLTAREIFKTFGKEGFQHYEVLGAQKAVQSIQAEPCVLAWGGGTVTNLQAVELFSKTGLKVHLMEKVEILYQRILVGGLPAFLSPEHPWKDFQDFYVQRTKLMHEIADLEITLNGLDINQALDHVLKKITSWEEKNGR